MILCRGDGSQWARDARLSGIMTRLMWGGRDGTVAAVGLLEAARVHVEPENVVERKFLDTTPFLSFSESQAKAAQFALGRNRAGVLQPCATDFGEDTTIFELDTSGMVNDGASGLFVLDYPCGMSLAKPLGSGPEFEGQEKAIRCEYCDPGNKLKEIRVNDRGQLLHRIQLIHVPLFLVGHPNRARYAGALKQAEQDREWLVYPLDYVQRLRGNAAKV